MGLETASDRLAEVQAKMVGLQDEREALNAGPERDSVDAQLQAASEEVRGLQDEVAAATWHVDAPATTSPPEGVTREIEHDGGHDQVQAVMREPEQGGRAEDPPREQARELDRTDELYATLQVESSVDPTPEYTAAVEHHAASQGASLQVSAGDHHKPEAAPATLEVAESIRPMRDGESLEGVIEDRVTIDGADFYTLAVEHESGNAERVMVPAVGDYEPGDSVAVEQHGQEVEMISGHGHER